MDVVDKDLMAALVEDAAPTPAEPADQGEPETLDTDEVLTDDANLIEDEDAPETEEAEEDPEEGGPDADEVELVTLTIDGEQHEVTFDDLVQSYQIDGAARKRLNEATLARKIATEEGRAEGMKLAEADIAAKHAEITQSREQLSELIGLVGPTLFEPRVNRPDPSMEQSDPIAYLSEMERWRDDQARLQGVQQQLAHATEAQRAQVEAQKAEAMATHRRMLYSKRPDLQDPEAQAAFTQHVRMAQEAVGFTSDEVNNFPDHRGLLLLDMLGKYIAREKAGGKTPAQRVVENARKPMKPGARTYTRSKAQKAQRENHKKAAASGDYRDVAKLMLTPKPQ